MMRTLEHVATNRWGIARDDVSHPINQLPLIEAQYGKANARKGLKMAINDVVEDLADLHAEATAEIDAELSAIGGMTLSEARVQFSKKLKRILKRGKARGEEEYYLLKNAEDYLLGDEAETCRRVLADFEATIDERKGR